MSVFRCSQHIADPASGNINSAVFVGASGRVDSTVAALDRNTVLRALVTCQQGLVTLLELGRFNSVNPAAHRRLLDILTEEFERLRRYITLLDMPPTELLVQADLALSHSSLSRSLCLLYVQNYIEKNTSEYSESEYATLWRNMCRRYLPSWNVIYAAIILDSSSSNRNPNASEAQLSFTSLWTELSTKKGRTVSIS